MSDKRSNRVFAAAWAKRFGIDVRAARLLSRLADRVGTCNVGVMNGDPHPCAPRGGDPDVASALWGKDLIHAQKAFTLAAENNGFGVNFDVGLYPFLTRDGDTAIEVPEVA